MAILALVLSILGPAGVWWWTRERFERNESAPTPPADLSPVREALRELGEIVDAVSDRLEELEDKVRDQTTAIAHGIEHVDRAERRIRSAVTRAKNRMEDLGYVDEGIEAEAQGLREIHGDAGRDERLHAMSGEVDAPSQLDLTGIPGDWS